MINAFKNYCSTFSVIYGDPQNWWKVIGASLIAPGILFFGCLILAIYFHGGVLFTSSTDPHIQRPIEHIALLIFPICVFVWMFCFLLAFVYMPIKRQTLLQKNLSLFLLLIGMFLTLNLRNALLS